MRAKVLANAAAHFLLVHLGALGHHDDNQIIDTDVAVLVKVKVEEGLVDGLLIQCLARSMEQGHERERTAMTGVENN